MFCERCGTKIEAGERFCPTCGNKIDVQTPSLGAAAYRPGVNTSALSGVTRGADSGSSNLLLSALGVLMLIWTFLPFVSVKLGKLAETAASYLGGLVPDEIMSLVNTKFNLYKIVSFASKDPDLKPIAIALVVFVVIGCLLAIASGIVNKKALYITAGSVSALQLLMWIVYVVYAGIAIKQANNEIKSYIGDYAEYLGGNFKLITGIHGIGLVLMIITLAVFTVLAFRQAVKTYR